MTINKSLVQWVYDELKYKGTVTNQTDFSERIGVTTSYVSKLLKSTEPLPVKIREQLVDQFGISRVWLQSGGKEGSMFSDAPPKPEVIPVGKHVPARLAPEQYGTAFPDWQGVPMYNMPITASFINSYRDEGSVAPQYFFRDPYFKDCDFGAVIAGDSMHSEIRHGDFVVLKEVTDMAFIIYGDIYYVIATNGLETCKYLNEDPKNPDNYLLVPRSERISPSPIPKHMVLKLYKVKGIIRGY